VKECILETSLASFQTGVLTSRGLYERI